MKPPLIVGLGGTAKPDSSSERTLKFALERCAAHGARTMMFGGAALDFPMYTPLTTERTSKAAALIAALRSADGILIASPGYHGTLSGLIKNALDYAEDMARDAQPYFAERAVGLIAVAAGWQATGTTVATLRAIVHALRGWPTPMAVAINSLSPVFGEDGDIADPALTQQIDIMAGQLVGFTVRQAVAA